MTSEPLPSPTLLPLRERRRERTGIIATTFRPNRVNGWFLRLFARPFAIVDGTRHAAGWLSPLRVTCEPGDHEVTVGVRYRGSSRDLGVTSLTVPLAAGEVISLVAVNGPLNHQPFTLRRAGETG